MLPFLLVLCASAVIAVDDYVSEVSGECKNKSDVFTCGKYEVAKVIAEAAQGSPFKMNIMDGVLDFVTLSRPETSEAMFPSARQISGDSEAKKIVKFIQRQVDAYLGSRAISVTLPGEAQIVDAEEPNNETVPVSDGVEARGKKKKAAMQIPLIILLKLFKVNIIAALILFVVVLIKKAILFMVLYAPSYLQMLKVCKLIHPPHAEDAHDFASTAYGHGGFGGHHKDWSPSRAFAA